MNTIISFLKDIDVDILSFITSVAKFLINKLDIALNANKPLYHQYIDPIGLLIGIAIVGLPFVFLIIYFFVLLRRGKKMGVIYDTPKEIDDEFWEPAHQDFYLAPMYHGMTGNLFDDDDSDGF